MYANKIENIAEPHRARMHDAPVLQYAPSSPSPHPSRTADPRTV